MAVPRGRRTARRCWAHPGIDIPINGKPLDPNGTYSVAVNDYIAKGGSGFAVLKRNTTRIETGISLRDSLIGYMQGFCTCEDIDAAATRPSKTGERCGTLINGTVGGGRADQGLLHAAQELQGRAEQARWASCTCLRGRWAQRGRARPPAASPPSELSAAPAMSPAGPYTGRCSCRDALAGTNPACGTVTPQLRSFCQNPTAMADRQRVEDGRIGRRVK